ncbi:MAG TPA: S41 family peptidase [Pyrinomonadaceae bacterium]|nr:S41 family peptidase [Pyrinomonadaceae bacterium]
MFIGLSKKRSKKIKLNLFLSKIIKLKLFVTCLLCVFLISTSFAQSFSSLERSELKDMLNAVKKAVKENYYDPTYKGIDLDAKAKIAEEKMSKATSKGQGLGIIAQFVMELNDSHTRFYPPEIATKFEYGWKMQMFGDKCYISAVKPKSDAEKQGLKIGDEVLAIEGFRPNRKEMWKINYYYNVLSPRAGINFKVKSPNDEQPRDLNIATKVTPGQARLSIQDLYRRYELSDEVVENRFVKINNTFIWKMPTFSIDPLVISNIMLERVNKSANFILDLRDNSGGYVVSLEELAGFFVEKDTKIADLVGRKKMDPQMAKTKGANTFKGKVIVLLNSGSASASEIFARFLQINERGVVIGDQSAGAVMQSRGFPMEMGSGAIVRYGMNMTNADVIMTDGKSIEHFGVTPHILLVPTGEDLANQRDPVLSAALQLLEEKVSPEEAGKLFPFKWED